MKLKHLDGAERHLVPNYGQGLCIQKAAAFVLDVPGAELCIGTFRASTPEEIVKIPNASRTPFIHAWAEWRGIVCSPTAKASCPRADYYRVNGASDIKRLSRPKLLKLAKEIGLSQHLRKGVPPKVDSVCDAILRAAGKAYRVGENSALLPGGDQ